MFETIVSKNQIPIRLTDERWAHITDEHSELAGMRYEVLETVVNPQKIVEGKAGEHLAIREIEAGKYLVVVYKEIKKDGFIITAFQTKRTKSLLKRKILWPT